MYWNGFHSDGLRSLPSIRCLDLTLMNVDYTGCAKKTGATDVHKRPQCSDVSLVCLGPYHRPPLHPLLSVSFSPLVCFCPIWITYSAFKRLCWMSVK